MYLAWLTEGGGGVDGDPLTDVTSRDRAVHRYRRHLREAGRSARYRDNALAALDDFYGRLGLGRAEVGRDGVPDGVPRELGPADRAAWLRAVEAWPHPRDRLLVLLPYYTGLRIGEVVALDRTDEASMDARLTGPLEEWLEVRRGWPGADGPALFLNRLGGRLSVRAAGSVFQAIAPDVTAEAVRNAAPPLREPGAPPEREALRGAQARRRERVVEAAVRLMVAVDYEKIQVKDVAAEAGVALGTLYRYFASKDHLFACALQRWATGFGDRIEYPAEAAVLDRVKAVYRRAARAFEGEPRIYEVLTQLEASRDEHAAAVYQEFVRTQKRAFGVALAELPEADRADIVWVMSAVLAEGLRTRMLGLMDMPQVYARIARTAELLLR